MDLARLRSPFAWEHPRHASQQSSAANQPRRKLADNPQAGTVFAMSCVRPMPHLPLLSAISRNRARSICCNTPGGCGDAGIVGSDEGGLCFDAIPVCIHAIGVCIEARADWMDAKPSRMEAHGVGFRAVALRIAAKSRCMDAAREWDGAMSGPAFLSAIGRSFELPRPCRATAWRASCHEKSPPRRVGLNSRVVAHRETRHS